MLPAGQCEGCGHLLRLVFARQVRRLLRVRARRDRLAPGQFGGVTLRDPDTQDVVPEPAQEGRVRDARAGAEPYTVGFPKPAEFFGFLATGEYTLVECYARTDADVQLDDGARRRPALQPVQEESEAQGGRREAEPEGWRRGRASP